MTPDFHFISCILAGCVDTDVHIVRQQSRSMNQGPSGVHNRLRRPAFAFASLTHGKRHRILWGIRTGVRGNAYRFRPHEMRGNAYIHFHSRRKLAPPQHGPACPGHGAPSTPQPVGTSLFAGRPFPGGRSTGRAAPTPPCSNIPRPESPGEHRGKPCSRLQQEE